MTDQDAAAVVALPGWWSSVAQAEQQSLAHMKGLDVRAACTHVVDGIALVTVELDRGAPAPAGLASQGRWAQLAHDAVADHAAHFGGRLFVFPGQAGLRGVMTAQEVLAGTVIDELVVPGHPGGIPGETRIEGLDYVRPVYRQGIVVLTLRPVAAGVFQPFERPRPAGALRPST